MKEKYLLMLKKRYPDLNDIDLDKISAYCVIHTSNERRDFTESTLSLSIDLLYKLSRLKIPYEISKSPQKSFEIVFTIDDLEDLPTNLAKEEIYHLIQSNTFDTFKKLYDTKQKTQFSIWHLFSHISIIKAEKTTIRINHQYI